MYRYLLWDLDGTLTDSSEGIVRSVRYAIEKIGGAIPNRSVLLKFIGPPLQDSFMQYCGYDEKTSLEAIRIFRERYVPIGQYENRATPGAAEMLARLKARGYVMALASSKPQELCSSICTRFDFARSLDGIFGSIPGATDTTKADVIRIGMARLGLKQTDLPDTLMIGDRKFDVLGAKARGLDCVGVDFFGFAEPGELENAGALSVCRTVEELESFIISH